MTTVLAAIHAAGNASGFQVVYSQGAETDATVLNSTMLDAAVSVAMKADVVIAVVGDSAEGYGHGTCAEGIDRDSLDLPGTQLDLLSAVAGNISMRQALDQAASSAPYSTSPVLAVTLIHGRPVTFGEGLQSRFGPRNDLLKSLPAVLSAWRPGALGGSAVWDVLTGAYNPSGRLAQGWPRTVGQVRQSNPWYQLKHTPNKDYSLGAKYAPLFPFGHGLSYGQFGLHDVKILSGGGSPASVADVRGLEPARNVPNAYRVSARYVREAAAAVRSGESAGLFSVQAQAVVTQGPDGDLVVQAYYSQDLSSRVRFGQMLLGFAKVSL